MWAIIAWPMAGDGKLNAQCVSCPVLVVIMHITDGACLLFDVYPQENGFAPLYVTSSASQKVIDKLKKAAVGCKEMVLATDEDREGEAISWHLLQVRQRRGSVFLQ